MSQQLQLSWEQLESQLKGFRGVSRTGMRCAVSAVSLRVAGAHWLHAALVVISEDELQPVMLEQVPRTFSSPHTLSHFKLELEAAGSVAAHTRAQAEDLQLGNSNTGEVALPH